VFSASVSYIGLPESILFLKEEKTKQRTLVIINKIDKKGGSYNQDICDVSNECPLGCGHITCKQNLKQDF
jgi:hypothetical protein